MPAPTLNLADSPFAAVLRVLIRTWKADAALRRLVKTWILSDGNDQPGSLPTDQVGVMLTVVRQPDQQYGPSTMIAPLVPTLRILSPGNNLLTALNLEHAFRRALYPVDETARLAIANALVAAGAEAHWLPTFAAAAELVGGTTPYYIIESQIQNLRVLWDFNP